MFTCCNVLKLCNKLIFNLCQQMSQLVLLHTIEPDLMFVV